MERQHLFNSKHPVNLSITHKLGAQEEAELNVGKSREPCTSGWEKRPNAQLGTYQTRVSPCTLTEFAIQRSVAHLNFTLSHNTSNVSGFKTFMVTLLPLTVNRDRFGGALKYLNFSAQGVL